MVNEQHLTALMVTHNMKDAIQIGNRLIMMNSGHIIYDVEGEEKKIVVVMDAEGNAIGIIKTMADIEAQKNDTYTI